MIARVSELWSRRNWLISGGFALLVVLIDLMGRISPVDVSSAEGGLLERVVPSVTWPKLSLPQVAELTEAYRVFDPSPPVVAKPKPVEVVKPKPKLPSLAEQQGELRQLIFAQQRYELMAVVAPGEGNAYALIRATHTETGAVSLERYESGAELSGLVLNIISLTRVSFSATQALLEQQGLESGFEPIVLMMYNR